MYKIFSLILLLAVTTQASADQFSGLFLGIGNGYGSEQDIFDTFGVHVQEMAVLTDFPGVNEGLSTTLDRDFGGVWRYFDSNQPTLDMLLVGVDGQWAAYCFKDNPCGYPSKQCFLGTGVSMGTWSTDDLGGAPVDHLIAYKGAPTGCVAHAPVPSSIVLGLVLIALLIILAPLGRHKRW
jgi:hypothetical protein